MATSGCGPTTMAMVVENLLGQPFPVSASAALALASGARVSGGTDLGRLARAVCQKFGCTYRTSDDIAQATAALTQGSVVVINVGGDRSGHKGIFSDGGHYVLALGMQGEQMLIADPFYYKGKFAAAHRRAVTVVDNWAQSGKTLLLCAPKDVASDAATYATKYHIFSR